MKKIITLLVGSALLTAWTVMAASPSGTLSFYGYESSDTVTATGDLQAVDVPFTTTTYQFNAATGKAMAHYEQFYSRYNSIPGCNTKIADATWTWNGSAFTLATFQETVFNRYNDLTNCSTTTSLNNNFFAEPTTNVFEHTSFNTCYGGTRADDLNYGDFDALIGSNSCYQQNTPDRFHAKYVDTYMLVTLTNVDARRVYFVGIDLGDITKYDTCPGLNNPTAVTTLYTENVRDTIDRTIEKVRWDSLKPHKSWFESVKAPFFGLATMSGYFSSGVLELANEVNDAWTGEDLFYVGQTVTRKNHYLFLQADGDVEAPVHPNGVAIIRVVGNAPTRVKVSHRTDYAAHVRFTPSIIGVRATDVLMADDGSTYPATTGGQIAASDGTFTGDVGIDGKAVIGAPNAVSAPALVVARDNAQVGIQNTTTTGTAGVSIFNNSGTEKGFLRVDAPTGDLQLGSPSHTGALTVTAAGNVTSTGNISAGSSGTVTSDVLQARYWFSPDNGYIVGDGWGIFRILSPTGGDPAMIQLGGYDNGHVGLKPEATMLKVMKADGSGYANLSADTVQPQGVITGYLNFLPTIKTGSSNWSMDENTSFYLVNTSANTTGTLTDAYGKGGRVIIVKNLSNKTTTIGTTGGQTIDGASTTTIVGQYKCKSFISDGSNWAIMTSF